MNKQIPKLLKPMNSLTNMDAGEKIVCLDFIDYKEHFAERIIFDFGDTKVKKKMNAMFEARYPF